MENEVPHHDEESQGPDSSAPAHNRKPSLLLSVVVWFATAVLLYLLLNILVLLGFRSLVATWNRESTDALLWNQFFEWFECAPAVGKYTCNINPLLYLWMSSSFFEFAMKLLQLISGSICFLLLIGAKLSPPRDIIPGLILIGGIPIVFGFPLLIDTIEGLTDTSVLLKIILGLIVFVLCIGALGIWPLLLLWLLSSMAILVLTTLISIPILVLSYFVSEVVLEVLPTSANLPVVIGSWVSFLVFCAGRSSDAKLHELLNHQTYKLLSRLAIGRPGS
jgi:hypothetical protein